MTRVFFVGANQAAWDAISIGTDSELSSATLYFYSETQPTSTGNYWHYVDGVPTVWAA